VISSGASLLPSAFFLEEAYGGRFISVLTQQEIDCLTLLIDRAIEIAPLPLHFDIGFIGSRLVQAERSACVRRDEGRDALAENPLRTFHVTAIKTPRMDFQPDGDSQPWQIGESADIPTV
jgi:hypothetical protein